MTDALSPIDRLRQLIAGDEALQTRFAALEDRDAFAAAAVEVAAGAGIALTPEAIEAAARPDPLHLAQFDPRPAGMTGWVGPGWLPTGIAGTQAGLAIDWAHFGEARLDDPFFQDTHYFANGLLLNGLMKARTPIASLITPAANAAGAPDGIIFHMSRCGSTLVSQMLAAMPGNIVVSEAQALDALVQLTHTHPQVPIEERVALLRGMAAALGRDRHGDRRRFFIKTDSWHSIALPLFRAAFPDTPWIFLFREPVEVMASQMRIRGSQTVPGMMPDAIYDIPDALTMPVEDYTARVLARVNAAAIAHRDLGGGLFVDYAELPGAVEERILPHFGIDPTPDEFALLHAAGGRNAKAPRENFASDTAAKRAEASDAVRAACAAHLDSIHDELKALAAVR